MKKHVLIVVLLVLLLSAWTSQRGNIPYFPTARCLKMLDTFRQPAFCC
jgi:hypothetical protein